jgi:hypothetical protein
MTTTPKLTDCDVGLYPVEFNVIIAPEVVEEKTKSGLFIPDQVKDMDQNATTKGPSGRSLPCRMDLRRLAGGCPQAAGR